MNGGVDGDRVSVGVEGVVMRVLGAVKDLQAGKEQPLVFGAFLTSTYY